MMKVRQDFARDGGMQEVQVDPGFRVARIFFLFKVLIAIHSVRPQPVQLRTLIISDKKDLAKSIMTLTGLLYFVVQRFMFLRHTSSCMIFIVLLVTHFCLFHIMLNLP